MAVVPDPEDISYKVVKLPMTGTADSRGVLTFNGLHDYLVDTIINSDDNNPNFYFNKFEDFTITRIILKGKIRRKNVNVFPSFQLSGYSTRGTWTASTMTKESWFNEGLELDVLLSMARLIYTEPDVWHAAFLFHIDGQDVAGTEVYDLELHFLDIPKDIEIIAYPYIII